MMPMERLTFEGNFCDIAQCRDVPGGSFCEDGACSQKKVWERLKAYEDTRRTPEAIADAAAPDALLKLAAQALETTPDELRGMAKARKDGRLAILPTARGDILTSEEVSAAQPFFDDVDVSVHYCTSNGMMIFVGYDAFRDWVKNWEIAAANKEAERAMEGQKND